MKLKKKNVLVTGGAGFIGSHLIDRLVDESPGKLIVVDNLFLGTDENLTQARKTFHSIKIYHEDAANYTSMKKILADEKIDVVFNLAVIPLPASLVRPKWTVTTNVAIVTVLCELLRKGYYETIIHFSSSEVYGTAQYTPMDEKHPLNPATPYAASKAAGDHIVMSYCKTFGIDAAIIRPFNNYGPRQNDKAYAGVIPTVIKRILLNKPIIIYGDGMQTRDFIYVGDVVDAAVKIYQESATRGKIINIATGHEVSINQIVKNLLTIFNTQVPIIHRDTRPADVGRHCGDATLAQSLFQFKPSTSLTAALRKTVIWNKKKNGLIRRKINLRICVEESNE